ncbi:MAG: hypothetical protein Q9162_002429 [Coniocarpon cinnabarinum]
MVPQDPKSWNPQPKAYKQPPYTIERPGVSAKPGETIPRVNHRCKDGLKSTPEPGIETVWDVVKRGSSKYGNAKAVGFRKLIKEHEEVKQIKKTVDGKEQMVDKKWTYYEYSGYEYISFIEYEKIAVRAGAGLRKLGMTTGDRVHLFGATSPWWLAMAHGSASQSFPIVTAYDSLGEEGLEHSMKQTHAKAIFLDQQLVVKLLNPLKNARDIQYVIYNSEPEGKMKQEDIDAVKNAHPHVTIMSFNDLQKLGQDNPVDLTLPEPADLCCVMYTSGSTGPPKGVLLSHKNVIAALSGIDAIVGQYIGPGDGLIAYLPLAHILEFIFELANFYWGGVMGYGHPKTLSDQSVKNCKGDIREFRPSIMVGVPAVWESVKKGIIGKVNASSTVVQNMFWSAMRAKSAMLNNGIPGAGVLDSLVFNKIKDATGGRLRICMSGGGPIAKDTQKFISMAITPMISGYGLTETSAMAALMDPAGWTSNAIGEMPACVEVKLVDCPDLGYLTTNNPPQGEIWIRGDSVSEGYLDLPEESKESFVDGWFKTGDIGEFDSKGSLRVTDRKKNLVKTLNGEYIALEKLESIYRSVPIVANICIYAAEDQQKPIAIIVPAEPALKSIANSNGVKGDSVEELVNDQKVNELVLSELQKGGKGGGLQSFELIQGVVLADEEWTPQNGLITSAQKLNRKGILNKYQDGVDRAYGK